MNSEIEQIRHRPPQPLASPRPLVLVCPQLKSNVNFSRIVRTAGCFGIRRLIACGRFAIDPEIARQATEVVHIESRRSLPPVIKRLREEGYRLVGLEQTNQSKVLYEYSFTKETALVIGHERQGIDAGILRLMHDVVEIPVYGLPHAHNVATATAIALYEYCRQYPSG